MSFFDRSALQSLCTTPYRVKVLKWPLTDSNTQYYLSRDAYTEPRSDPDVMLALIVEQNSETQLYMPLLRGW